MPRAMIHPYYGDVVVCAQHDGSQHEHQPFTMSVDDACERCGDVVATCTPCRAAVSCCSCGDYHSIDCPWPL